MTATEPDKIATDDDSAPDAPLPDESNQARAERLLYRLADLGEVVMDSLDDSLDIPDYLLTVMTQAATALVQLAALDAQRAREPLAAGRIEVIVDGTGDVWVAVPDDKFECVTGHCEDLTREQIRQNFSPIRDYVLRPSITAQEAETQ